MTAKTELFILTREDLREIMALARVGEVNKFKGMVL